METTQQNRTTRQSGLRQVEEAIICCLLLSENEILNVAPVLKPEMFDSPEMRFIYQAICALNDQGIKADLVTTETEMRKIDETQFTEMNGLGCLSEAFGRVRRITNLMQYAEEVKRHYMLRLLCTLFVGLQGKANFFEASYTDVPPEHLRITGLTRHDLCQMEKLAGDLQSLPLYFDYTPANTVENIRAQAHLQMKRGQCDLIIVDYLNELSAKRLNGETMEQVVSRNIRALKALAVELDRPVLVLSQLNRNSENRQGNDCQPELHDLRDSGTIEQEADCIFFVYRPARHGIKVDEETGESLIGLGQLLIRKTRNGPTGVARYRYNESYTRITNYSKR